MLLELSVNNFALIERLNLSFGPGFNVLTGETGAGKSIIVGAINLILGGRASSELIRQGSDEAEVQALFAFDGPEVDQKRLRELIQSHRNDEMELLIRRVLPRTGRNRIYINGNLATLAQLEVLGRELVAVSGQNEHQQLLDPERQLLILDQFGGLLPLRDRMTDAFDDLMSLKTELRQLERDIKRAREKTELFEFQSREIKEAAPTPGEDDELEKERDLIRNAEKIFTLVKQSYNRLYGEAGAVVETLDAVRTDMDRAAGMDERLSPTLTQIGDAFHQLDDAAEFLRRHLDRFVFDPVRLEEVEDRLALLNRLKRKYGPSLDDVMNYERQAAGQLDRIEDMTERRTVLNADIEASEKNARRIADKLGAARRDKAEKMSALVAGQLRELGMPHLEFGIAFLPPADNPNPGPLGWDEIQFMISPNLGEELKPLSKIASGGELSRTVLGIKSILAGQDKVQTIIFDEVDAGIGGAVAEVVGRKIKELAAHHQLLCITHLPQIAAFGRHHHHVFKEVRGKRTITGIRPLSSEEKVEEIAGMLGGIESSDKARAAARELIARAGG